MSDPSAHPRDSHDLIGHAEIERLLLDQALESRLPNAYLLIGAPGIGKATMAWRLARFLLSGAAEPPAASPGLFGDLAPPVSPSTLAVAREHPAVARMLAGSHADFLVIEREWDDKKKAHKPEIPVEAARRIGGFLSHTAGEGRWKVVLIDPAEALNIHAANAILKWLEEPPANSLFLLVSNNPGLLLPTLRSRCRVLALSTPDQEGFAAILSRSGQSIGATERDFLHHLAGGSPGIALQLKRDHAERLYSDMLGVIESSDSAAAMSLAEKLTSGKEPPSWDTLQRLVMRFLAQVAKAEAVAEPSYVSIEERQAVHASASRKPLDYWLELWEKSTALLVNAEHLHLNRKHALMAVLLALAGHEGVSAAME